VIHQDTFPSEQQAKWIIEESKANWSAEHFNRNWLDYRKSVTEAGDWAAVEWTGSGCGLPGCAGARIPGLPGCVRLDWTWAGAIPRWSQRSGRSGQDAHAVVAGVDRSAARRAGAASFRDHARQPEVQLVRGQRGPRIDRSGHQDRQVVYTGKPAFIVAVGAFHGKTMGSLFNDWQGGLSICVGTM